MQALIGDYKELNQGHFKLSREREALLQKEQQVISQIEMLVSKLKTVEKWS